MDTTKSNKLIAKFMGMNFDPALKVRVWSQKKGWIHKKVHFHCDWNWLMPVVEKIEAIKGDEYYSEYTFTATNHVQNYTANIINRANVEILTVEGMDRKDVTYKAVIEFIKWYNSKK